MKNKKYAYLILAIAFAVFNVIAIFIPIERKSSFWAAFVFTGIAFLMQPVIWSIALKNAETRKAKFWGIPIIYFGTVYLISQLIAFSVMCVIPVGIRLSIVIETALLGFALIGIVSINFGRKVISDADEKVKGKVTYIRELQTELELIFDAEKVPAIRTELQKLTEAIRYSDPMSDDSSADIEKAISGKVRELKSADDKMPLIYEMSDLIAERNKKCKIKNT